jgi:hypothetical protein
MRSLILLLCVQLILQSALGQPGREPRRRDTAFGFGWDPWHQQVCRVPVLLNPETATVFQPTQKICFDKKIFVKGSTAGRMLDMYIFINTTDGIIGMLSGREGSLGNGELKTNDPKFRFSVIGKKGNVFNYQNSRKRNGIEHYVSTGNTQTHLYNFDFTAGNDVINKKIIRNSYCDNKFKTWSYKADGDAAPVFHVFGHTYPNKLVCKDFIGYSGVGYLQTDEGTYIVCEMEKGSFFTEMREFEDVVTCFDATPFKEVEQEMYGKMQTGIARQKEILDGKSFSGACSAEKTRLNNFQKQVLEKQKQNLQTAQSGNAYQNKDVQKAYAGISDPVDIAQQGIYNLDVKICKIGGDIARAAAKGQNTESLQTKLDCYHTQKKQLEMVKVQMQALNTTYASNPGQANAEKMRLLLRNQHPCN